MDATILSLEPAKKIATVVLKSANKQIRVPILLLKHTNQRDAMKKKKKGRNPNAKARARAMEKRERERRKPGSPANARTTRTPVAAAVACSCPPGRRAWRAPRTTRFPTRTSWRASLRTKRATGIAPGLLGRTARRGAKQRLHFTQFDKLRDLLVAAGGSEAALFAALAAIAATRRRHAPAFSSLGVLEDRVRIEAKKMAEAAAAGGADTAAADAVDLNEGADVLVNLLYAPNKSRLYSLMRVLSRIENLSHILVWSKASALGVDVERSQKVVEACCSIDRVELPRLKLTLNVRQDLSGVLRLYSMDHADLFVSNERNAFLTDALRGIEHSLILSNAKAELQVLVPVLCVYRPAYVMSPLGTRLVLDRESWNVTQRYFVFDVHVSTAFLQSRGVEASLYLLCLRFLNRDYRAAFRLADGIAADGAMTHEMSIVFSLFENPAHLSQHPDSVACRMKIALMMRQSNASMPWNQARLCAEYVFLLDYVSSDCRLAADEEYDVLCLPQVAREERDPARYGLSRGHLANINNRRAALKALLKDGDAAARDVLASGATEDVMLKAPERMTAEPWPYAADDSIFGVIARKPQLVTRSKTFDKLRRGGPAVWLEDTNKDPAEAATLLNALTPPAGWLAVAIFGVPWNKKSSRFTLDLPQLSTSTTTSSSSRSWRTARACTSSARGCGSRPSRPTSSCGTARPSRSPSRSATWSRRSCRSGWTRSSRRRRASPTRRRTTSSSSAST